MGAKCKRLVADIQLHLIGEDMKKWFREHKLKLGLVFRYTKDNRIVIKPTLFFHYENAYDYSMTLVDWGTGSIHIIVTAMVPMICVNPQGRRFDPQTGRSYEAVLKLA